MTLMIDLEPEVEKRLRAAASQEGLKADEYARVLIERQLPTVEANRQSLWDTLTPEEWIRETTEWAQSHDRSIPLLSDEAVSRESFYECRL
jgi:hypothetical protein